MRFGAIEMGKPKIEYLPYKCSNCGVTLALENVTPLEIYFDNGSILTHYYCEKCYKERQKNNS